MENLVFNYFNEIEKESRLRVFIQSELERESELYTKIHNHKYIVSVYIHSLYAQIDAIRVNISNLKKDIDKIGKQEYRKLAKKYL